MIIGNGLIAKALKEIDSDNILFLASGVSNSLEIRKSEFLREQELLEKCIYEYPQKTAVYFSTCSIYDSSKNNSLYVLHKLKMEQLIALHCENYYILRVSNAVGKGGNPNLLLNYLVDALRNNQKVTVHTKAKRNLIDVDDIKNITAEILKNFVPNQILNVAYLQNYSIIEITEKISQILKLDPKLYLLHEGSGYDVITTKIESYFKKRNLTDQELYLENIIKKYYLI